MANGKPAVDCGTMPMPVNRIWTNVTELIVSGGLLLDRAGPDKCFVVMPFGKKLLNDGSGDEYDFDKVYRVVMQRAIRLAGAPTRSGPTNGRVQI